MMSLLQSTIISQPVATVLVGFLTAAVTIGGWIALHYFTLEREAKARLAADDRADRIKRLEILLKHADTQISEFYGPIHGLIHQIWATWEVKQRLKANLEANAYKNADHYIGDRYFSPLHDKIRTILREKMHLIDGVKMPDSFYDYVQHSVMENIQINLWNEKQIDSSKVKGIPWPDRFPSDIKAGLDIATQRYDAILSELRANQTSSAKSGGANID